MKAVAVLQAGDRERAREALLALWAKWSDQYAPLERCTIAHFLADTEEEPGAELEWDLRALEAATGTGGDAEDRQPVDSNLNGFLPSLHLNAGDACRRVGDQERARRHAEIGLAHAHALDGDGYGKTIRQGLERLLARVNGAS